MEKGRGSDLFEFDPDNITQAHMDKLATCLECYLDLIEHMTVMDDDLKKKVGDDMEEGIKRTKKLISKLRNGKTGVFIDRDD